MHVNTAGPEESQYEQELEQEKIQEKAEVSHILPGGSRLDTTLAVPVPSLEGGDMDGNTAGPEEGQYEQELEQDLIWLAKNLVEKLKSRWTITNPGVDNILDRVVGWADVNAELRIHLLGWLATRTDDQILDEAVEMVGALKNVAYTRTITKMGEDIMVGHKNR